jgi:hypothetical protein
MSNRIFGDGTCAGIQVVLHRSAWPKAHRWTLRLVRRSALLAPTPDLVRVSFKLPDRIFLEAEHGAHAFFLQRAAGTALTVLPADTFSEMGANIEIFFREPTFSVTGDTEIEASPSVAFRLNRVIDEPVCRELPVAIDAMLIFGIGPIDDVEVPQRPARSDRRRGGTERRRIAQPGQSAIG